MIVVDFRCRSDEFCLGRPPETSSVGYRCPRVESGMGWLVLRRRIGYFVDSGVFLLIRACFWEHITNRMGILWLVLLGRGAVNFMEGLGKELLPLLFVVGR